MGKIVHNVQHICRYRTDVRYATNSVYQADINPWCSLFFCPRQVPGTTHRTTWEIRRSPLTFLNIIWKLSSSMSTKQKPHWKLLCLWTMQTHCSIELNKAFHIYRYQGKPVIGRMTAEKTKAGLSHKVLVLCVWCRGRTGKHGFSKNVCKMKFQNNTHNTALCWHTNFRANPEAM